MSLQRPALPNLPVLPALPWLMVRTAPGERVAGTWSTPSPAVPFSSLR
ncbi:MAG: hypothetical protein GX174_10215 [Lentisphaerae bacterium]|nr:hypothetical protein [Lentisphaerota bacterium]